MHIVVAITNTSNSIAKHAAKSTNIESLKIENYRRQYYYLQPGSLESLWDKPTKIVARDSITGQGPPHHLSIRI